jgi:hypothetical protein
MPPPPATVVMVPLVSTLRTQELAEEDCVGRYTFRSAQKGKCDGTAQKCENLFPAHFAASGQRRHTSGGAGPFRRALSRAIPWANARHLIRQTGTRVPRVTRIYRQTNNLKLPNRDTVPKAGRAKMTAAIETPRSRRLPSYAGTICLRRYSEVSQDAFSGFRAEWFVGARFASG